MDDMVTRKEISQWCRPLRTPNGKVNYYNFWDKQDAVDIWFSGFLDFKGFHHRYPKTSFTFFSTLGSVNLLKIDTLINPWGLRRKRVFFSGENVHHPYFLDYNNNLLEYRTIDLSLGFDYYNNSRYLRFPIWLLEMFPPQSTIDDIKRICNQLSYQKLMDERNRFCALVSGTSTMLGTESIKMRTLMVNQMETIGHVDCAGKLLHNTDELKDRFKDNKAEYLKQYRFYICPENASVEGYVTEKLFHCIGSGCIPVYWGACGNPEPDVLNHDAILFWEKDGDNKELLSKISELQDDPHLYREFFEQPRLKENAWQVVANYFDSLEQRLNDLFC